MCEYPRRCSVHRILCCGGLINRGNNISVYLFDINDYYVFIVGAYVGVISFILILSPIKKVWTIIRLISEKTLFIMCTHYFFPVVVYTKIVEKNTSLKGTLAGLCTMLFYAVLLYVWEHRSKLVQRLKVFRGSVSRDFNNNP